MNWDKINRNDDVTPIDPLGDDVKLLPTEHSLNKLKYSYNV